MHFMVEWSELLLRKWKIPFLNPGQNIHRYSATLPEKFSDNTLKQTMVTLFYSFPIHNFTITLYNQCTWKDVVK